MVLPKPEYAIHKAWMYRVLQAIADHPFLANTLHFKGGTCAAMRGFIERFSVDLDFDLEDKKDVQAIQAHLEKLFRKLHLKIKEKSQRAPQYFLQYPTSSRVKRNTLKVEITFPAPRENDYECVRFVEIDRILSCHTVPTMVANKLVAVIDRFKQHGILAGRDLFDIQAFLLQGHPYKTELIEERTAKKSVQFFRDLQNFIEKYITQTVIDQDLNTLLPVNSFHQVRKSLKSEVLWLLKGEEKRLKKQA